MQPSLAERAAKILDEFGDLPLRSLVVQSELSVSDRSLCNLGIDISLWQLFTDEHRGLRRDYKPCDHALNYFQRR